MSRLTWRRTGTRRPFQYFDARGRRIRDAETIERLDSLAIPPAWKDVKLSSAPRAKLQATGIDSAGRRQYRYHPDFRAQQEAAKFQELIRFAEKLRICGWRWRAPDPRPLIRYVCAVAIA
jgi:DNA topoisomerase-1